MDVVKVHNIDITFDAIYLRMERDYYEPEVKKKKDEKKEVEPELRDCKELRIRQLDLKWEEELSYENSEFKAGYTMDNLFF